jgi:glycosyltransferase involved in cell wall biosynthesis
MVTTTTEYLAENLRKINKNVVVLPNLMDFNAYPQIECVKKEIRIGWQGGYSHYEDLWIIKDAIKEILRKYPQVKFVFCGDMRFYGLFRDVPIDRVECHSWVENNAYPFKLATMNLDIGLCPLVDNEFNKNKSAIKYLEYSMFKTATIASNMLPYSPVITNEKDGLLVDENGWFDAMERLILDKQKRKDLGSNAYENVYQNHNADTKAFLWADAFQKLMNKDVKELVTV